MDQPQAQPQPARTQEPTHRDMMYCHECHDEWYRDEHGLTCPECGSDFTEIIEENHDPRDDSELLAHGHPESDDEAMPPLENAPPHLHPLIHQNPWQGHADDPDEGDISNLQFRQLGPGRFAVTGTMYRTVSPPTVGGAQGGAGGNPGFIASLLGNIVGGNRGASAQHGNHGNQTDQNNQGPERQGTPGSLSGSGFLPGGSRFAYTAGARLYPRDANHPEAYVEPVDELNNVLVGLMAAFGQPPEHHHHEHFHGHGPIAVNPLVHLMGQLFPLNGQIGDAVYSQEALDRIITQLMEQNASSNAPGPASQSDIENLPRKQVTIEMLGSDGRAECSICMDEVNVGEEVAELPCHHWFHHPCIAAWLGEHDTCPHCRKGITKLAEQNQGNNTQGASGSSPNRSMPGAFGVSGEGTTDNPYVLPGSPPPNTEAHSDNGASGSAEDSSAGGSIGERLRRGLFGPPR